MSCHTSPSLFTQMHFFIANRLTCLVLLFTLTITSSMSQEICENLRNQQEKIRAIGEANNGTTLVIITTSGHIFELDQNSSIIKSNGDYHLNISQEPSRHVSNEWSDVKLNLSENKNLLYGLYYTKNFLSVNLRAIFKTELKWNDCLNTTQCRPFLVLGGDPAKARIDFNNCHSVINHTDDGLAFLVSHTCHTMTEPNCQIMFLKPKGYKSYCYNSKFCFKPKNGDTVLAASYLTKPYNILLFIYSSGLVEIREVDTFPNNQNIAPEPVWAKKINDFIHCEATVLPVNLQIYWIIMITVILLLIIILSLYIYKIEIMSDSSREKKRKKRKKKRNKKHSPSTVNTKTSKGGTPSGSPASSSAFENSPKGSSTGVKFLTAQGSLLKESPSASGTSATANRSNHAKSSELTFATAQGSSVKGSTVTGTSLVQGSNSRGSSALGKPSFSFELGSTTNSASLTPNSSPTNVQGKGLSSPSGTSTAKRSCPTKSPGFATAQNSNPKGSSTELGFATAIGSSSSNQKVPSTTPPKTSPQPKKDVSPKKSSLSSNDGTTLSSAFGTTTTPTRPQNVNSKDSSKRTLVQKKQTMFKWLVSLFREKKKKMEKRNNKSKPKDPKKDSEEK